jgi:hypothetical protein
MAQKEKRQARRENGGSYRRAARRAARRESRDSRREADRQSRRIESFRDDRDSIILRKPPVEAPLSLALHDWQRRDLISKISKDRETESLTEMEYQKRLKKTLPASYTEAGIVYRLPGWKAMNPAASGASYRTPFDPPRVRHSDEVYASCCHKLVTVLQGSARTWAVCEFFYSDLDKAWYVSYFTCQLDSNDKSQPSFSVFEGTIEVSLLKMWQNWEYRQARCLLVESGQRFDVVFRTSPVDLRKDSLPPS